MTNSLYGKAKEAFLTKKIDWVNDDIRCVFVDSTLYTPNLDTDEFLDDIPEASRILAMSESMQNKTCVLGVCDSDDILFESATLDEVEYIVIYLHTGTDSTSRLIALIDDANNLPVSSSGYNVKIKWPNGAKKIFSI